MILKSFSKTPLWAVLLGTCTACGGDGASASDGGAGGSAVVQGACGTFEGARYQFTSRFDAEQSSVFTGGQIARHVLIAELTAFIQGLSERLDRVSYSPGQVLSELALYVDNDGELIDAEPLSFELPAGAELLQSTHGDVSGGKNLRDKLAGNDSATDHVDFSAPGSFIGFDQGALGGSVPADVTPSGLLDALFDQLDARVVLRANGDADSLLGESLPVHVTPEGVDLAQLTQKFLLAAVTFSQGVDDYLSNDVDGKGLLSANERDGEEPFTTLEHAWDEGFGYFGAARDYDAYTDEELAAKGGRDGFASGYHDTNGDCSVDLVKEVSFGASQNAAKRDFGATEPIDLSGDAFDAFVLGRTIIAGADGKLSEADMTDLVEQRDRAIGAWEQAIAATVVHYINAVLADHERAKGGADYAVLDHAKHWSELKGFALSFQFNPDSPVFADVRVLHERLGVAPVLPDALPATNGDALDAYAERLLQARQLLEDAFGFSAANVEGW